MKTLLLAGRTGQVGGELEHALAPLGRVIALDRRGMDLADPDSILAAVRAAKPAIIVNAAGFTAVDDAERQPELAMQVNGIAPGILAEEAKRIGAVLVHYSTDYVFDGTKGAPYIEEDVPNPVNAYGRTKLAGEKAIMAAGGAYLILRTSWVYSRRGSNFVLKILELARSRTELSVVTDQTGSPSWARELAHATAALLAHPALASGASGIYHLAAAGETSRYDFARLIVSMARERSGNARGWATIRPTTSEKYPLLAQRPRYLSTSKLKLRQHFGMELPTWIAQLQRFISALYEHPT